MDDLQISDFSSSYFEGKNAEFAAHGYSRDHRPDKKQVTWGISTAISGIPTALTIQRGSVQDKTHMREMLRVCMKILNKGSLLMFDCGANTPKIKDTIVENCLHYLTLKPKKVGTYKNLIKGFDKECGKSECNGAEYLYTKKPSKRPGEFLYIYFSKKLSRTGYIRRIQSSRKGWQKATNLSKRQKGTRQSRCFLRKKVGSVFIQKFSILLSTYATLT